MEHKPITIRDVAKEAGVSISTVSRAFNNYSDINSETREKILRISEELGYVPNIVARSLVSSKNYRLGLLIEDYDPAGLSNQMTFEIVMSFKNAATKQGFETVLLTTTSDMQKSERLDRLFSERHLDGAFIMGLKMTDEYYKELKEIKLPCVLMDVNIKSPMVSCIGIDNIRGAFLATEYLIKNGHKKIAFINGSREAFVSYERLDGYNLALNRYNIHLDNSLVDYGDFNDTGAERAVEKLFNEHNDITGIFCASDIMAIGTINKLNELGFSVPEDVSVVGFDDIFAASLMSPKVTTIKQDRNKIGETAVNLLLNSINGQKIDRVLIEPELVIRESVKEI
jgi:LacI family transcriptional regulator